LPLIDSNDNRTGLQANIEQAR